MFAPQTLAAAAILAVLFVVTGFASSSGWGLDAPERNPPSIREGSVRTGHGVGGTRFFVGGGHRAGK